MRGTAGRILKMMHQLPERYKLLTDYSTRQIQLRQVLNSIPCQELNASPDLCRTPVVSVLMLAYCHEKYISRAIESVMMQKTDFDFELIIAEDHSPDQTLEVACKWQKRFPHRIRLLTADQNVGMQKNCWRMYEHARGDFYAFCDADDFWNAPDKLQKQVDLLRNTPECVMCHSNYSYLNTIKGCKKIIRFNRVDLGDLDGKELLQKLVVDQYRVRTPSMVFRADAFHEIFPLFGTIPHPAYDFSVCFLLALTGGRFCYIDEPLATYCQVASSVTARDNFSKRYRFIREVATSGFNMMKIFQFWDLLELQERYFYPQLMELALFSGDFYSARQYNNLLLKIGYYHGGLRVIAQNNIMLLLLLIQILGKIVDRIKLQRCFDR